MEDIFKFVIDNKEWLFSGILVFALGLLIQLFRSKRGNGKKLRIKSGKGSINIQAGDNVSIGENRNDK